ncbi:hypothetical protein [Streptomyces sp. NPDC050560]|uniref:hypothetical protein n=1 Tax=Streptomyces sp. NPDC050560 TaxID=3365630 RepID=UPI0037925454
MQDSVREDRTAFGLYDAMCAAARRLTAETAGLAREPDFTARFTVSVGGTGGTVTDAAVRRAAATSARCVHEERAKAPTGAGITGELFCLLYKLFFADVVAEFVRGAVAESVKGAVPVLHVLDPGDHVADWVADQVMEVLPDPCEETQKLAEAVEEAASAAEVVADPLASLADVAYDLIPVAAERALGLVPAAEGGNPDDRHTLAGGSLRRTRVDV